MAPFVRARDLQSTTCQPQGLPESEYETGDAYNCIKSVRSPGTRTHQSPLLSPLPEIRPLALASLLALPAAADAKLETKGEGMTVNRKIEWPGGGDVESMVENSSKLEMRVEIGEWRISCGDREMCKAKKYSEYCTCYQSQYLRFELLSLSPA